MTSRGRRKGAMVLLGSGTLVGVAAAFVVSLPLRAQEAPLAEEPVAGAPADGEAKAPDRTPFLEGCVTDEDRLNASKGEKNKAFRSSSVPLGPFYWATADRQLVQAGLVYWRILDVEEDTRLTLLLPLFLDHCSPEANTWLGPFGLWGGQTDLVGTAGWWGPYFFRRDKDRESDVLFPLFWSLREPEKDTLVAGPWFHLRRGARHTQGLLPFYFGTRDDDVGSFFDIAPGFARWGRGAESNFVLLQTWAQSTPESSTVLSIPFYYSHDEPGRKAKTTVVPPLLFASVTEGERQFTLAGPWVSKRSPHGEEMGVLPFYLHGELKSAEHHSLLGGLFEDDQPSSYTLIPPLLFAHSERADGTSTTWLANSWWTSAQDGASWSAAVAPVYFAGRDGDDHYTYVPPLLYGSWNEGDVEHLQIAQTRVQTSPGEVLVSSPPFVWSKDSDQIDDVDWFVSPPLLTALVEQGGPDPFQLTLIGPWYDFVSGPDGDQDRARGIAPVWFSGRDAGGAGYDVIPPLAFARWNDGPRTATLVGQTLVRTSANGWRLASFPFAFVDRGLDGDGRSTTLLPPLLFADWRDVDGSLTVVGTGWYQEGRALGGRTHTSLGLLPFYAGGRLLDADGSEVSGWDLAPLLATYASRSRERSALVAGPWYSFDEPGGHEHGLVGLYAAGEVSEGAVYDTLLPVEGLGLRPRRYWGIPLLLSGRYEDQSGASFDLTAGAYKLRTSRGDLHQGWAPFFFRGRLADGARYDIAPLLATAAWGDRDHLTLLSLQTRYEEDRGTGAWELLSPPFVFAGEDGQGAFHTVVPPLLYASWGDAHERHTWAFQTWAHTFDGAPDAGRDDELFVERPGQVGGYDLVSVPFVVSGDRTTGEHWTVIPPLAYAHFGASADEDNWIIAQTWFQRRPSSWRLLSVPFYYGSVDDEAGRYAHLVPLLGTFLWGDRESTYRLITAWVDLEDEQGHDRGLLPFYLAGATAGTSTRTPLLGALRDYALEDTVLAEPFDAFFDRPFSYAAGPGFLHHSTAQGSTTLVGSGWYLTRDEGTTRYFGLAPLFAHGDWQGGGYDVIPPLLFARWSSGTAGGLWAGPWLSVTDATGEEWYGLFPVLYGHNQGTDHLLLSPVAARWGDGNEEHLWALQTVASWSPQRWSVWSVPFYFGHEDETDGTWSHLVPPLATFLWGDRDSRYRVIGPWVDVEDPRGRDLGLLPLFVAGHTAEASSTTPLLAAFREQVLKSSPLLGAFDEVFDEPFSYAAGPGFFYRGTEHGSLTLVGTGWWNEDERDESRHFGVAPFYAHGQWRGGGYDVAPPLLFARYQDGGTGGWWVGPWLSWREEGGERWYGLFPVLYGHERGTEHLLVSPGYARWGDGHDESLWLAQTWADWSDERWRVWSIPFYFGAREGDVDGYDVIPPLAYARWQDGTDHGRVVGPWFDVQLGEERYTGVAPAYVSGSSPQGGFLLAPGVWHRWDKSSTTTWALQTSAWSDASGWGVASHPFYYGGVQSTTGDYHHHVPLALTFLWGTEREGYQRHNRVIGPFLHLETATGHDDGLLPVYLSGEGTWTALSPYLKAGVRDFLGEEAARPFDSGPFHYLLLPGYARVAADDGTASTTLVAQTLVHSSRDSWQVWSAPFYFGADHGTRRYHVVPPALSGHWADDTAGTFTTVIPPALYASWGTRREQTTVIGPWVSRTTPTSRVRGVVPFWVDAEDGDRFLQMYSPLVWQWGRNGPTDETGVRPEKPVEVRTLSLATLSWFSADESRQRLIAPLVWHYADGDTRETIVFPAYWDVVRPEFDVRVIGGVVWQVGWAKDSGGKNLLIAPGYARYEDDEELMQVAGPVAWSLGKGESASAWALHLGPVLSLWSYHPNHFRWRAGMGAFGYEREGDKEQYTVLWMKSDPT